MDEKYYKISESELLSLIASSVRLNALECYGVDNWDGYGEALEEFWESYKEECPEVINYSRHSEWFDSRAIAQYELNSYDEI